MTEITSFPIQTNESTTMTSTEAQQALEKAQALEQYPPQSTGDNVNEAELIVFSSNVTDSVAGADLTVYVTAKHNNNGVFPNPIYDVGALSIDVSEVKFTNISGGTYSFTISIGGTLKSDSTANNARISERINSTGGVGTGTRKLTAAGTTPGAATVETAVTTDGAFTLAVGESVWLEVSKSVTGTLVLEEALIIIKPLW